MTEPDNLREEFLDAVYEWAFTVMPSADPDLLAPAIGNLLALISQEVENAQATGWDLCCFCLRESTEGDAARVCHWLTKASDN